MPKQNKKILVNFVHRSKFVFDFFYNVVEELADYWFRWIQWSIISGAIYYLSTLHEGKRQLFLYTAFMLSIFLLWCDITAKLYKTDVIELFHSNVMNLLAYMFFVSTLAVFFII